jgi:hypothetical protein
MRQLVLVIFFISLVSHVFSQGKTSSDSFRIVRKRVINGDTSLISEIPEVQIFPGYIYKDWWDNRKYLRLVRNVKAAYPYAKIAGEKLKDIDQRLSSMNSERQRKVLINYTEEQLKKEFESALRGLTISQGRILIKLIYRETGNTSYKVLQDLKGNFSAGFWQTVARIFGNNLKSQYDPYGEDLMIEMIIGLIESGQI